MWCELATKRLTRCAGGAIPPSESCERVPHQRSPPRPVRLRAFRIRRRHRPCKARGRMAIADMRLTRVHACAHRDGMRIGNHYIVAVKCEPPDEARTEHNRIAKPPPRTGKMLQRRRCDAAGVEARTILGAHEVDERVDIGTRKHVQEFRQHAFAAAPGVEPVVDQGDAHIRRSPGDERRHARRDGFRRQKLQAAVGRARSKVLAVVTRSAGQHDAWPQCDRAR